MVPNQSCLPPFIVPGVDDVQDVSVGEGEAQGGAVVILIGIVVKQSPGEGENRTSAILSHLYIQTHTLY